MCRGYVEQVVGHPRQCLYLSLDDREHLASLDRARRGGIPEHVKRASDRGERVAQLVRKRRQETVLGVLLCSQPCGGRGEVIVGVAQRPVESIQLTGPVEQSVSISCLGRRASAIRRSSSLPAPVVLTNWVTSRTR